MPQDYGLKGRLETVMTVRVQTKFMLTTIKLKQIENLLLAIKNFAIKKLCLKNKFHNRIQAVIPIFRWSRTQGMNTKKWQE